MWFALSLLSAFGQALGWAIKKKALDNHGVNNLLAVVSYSVAAIFLACGYVFDSGWTLPVLSERYWFALSVVVGLNIIAAWCAYRALDLSPLSFLMPFMALSAVGIIPVEYFVRDVWPSAMQIVGVLTIVSGAIIFSYRRLERGAWSGAAYFAVTVLCYSVSPVYGAVAVREAGSGLLCAAMFHLGIALGFAPLYWLAKENRALKRLRDAGIAHKTGLLMILAGMIIALFENGPNTVALGMANASEVMAIKRVMPLFALLLGGLMFHEKVNRRHVIGTLLLVIGSALIVWCRSASI